MINIITLFAMNLILAFCGFGFVFWLVVTLAENFNKVLMGL